MSTKGKLNRRVVLIGIAVSSGIPLLYLSPLFQTGVNNQDFLKNKEFTVINGLLKAWTKTWPRFGERESYHNELEAGLNGVLKAVREDKRDELILLLKLLSYGPTCFFLTGHLSPWADSQKVHDILVRWQHSTKAVEKKVYMAFSSLFAASYYGNPSSWNSAKYPGPPSFHLLEKKS